MGYLKAFALFLLSLAVFLAVIGLFFGSPAIAHLWLGIPKGWAILAFVLVLVVIGL